MRNRTTILFHLLLVYLFSSVFFFCLVFFFCFSILCLLIYCLWIAVGICNLFFCTKGNPQNNLEHSFMSHLIVCRIVVNRVLVECNNILNIWNSILNMNKYIIWLSLRILTGTLIIIFYMHGGIFHLQLGIFRVSWLIYFCLIHISVCKTAYFRKTISNSLTLLNKCNYVGFNSVKYKLPYTPMKYFV